MVEVICHLLGPEPNKWTTCWTQLPQNEEGWAACGEASVKRLVSEGTKAVALSPSWAPSWQATPWAPHEGGPSEKWMLQPHLSHPSCHYVEQRWVSLLSSAQDVDLWVKWSFFFFFFTHFVWGRFLMQLDNWYIPCSGKNPFLDPFKPFLYPEILLSLLSPLNWRLKLAVKAGYAAETQGVFGQNADAMTISQ